MAIENDREFDFSESGETESDLEGQINYSDAVLWGTDWTTETILNQLKKNNIILDPKFQRRDAWNKDKKSRFIESLMMGLPIPQIILAESKEKRGQYIVIDGKQRLLSIRQFFTRKDDEVYNQLKLYGLENFKDLNGKTIEDLEKDNIDYVEALQNQTIRTIVIKNWPNEKFLYTVFLRLNTGSLQLSPQELRQALHPGSFIDYVDDFAIDSENIKKILNLSKPDYRMRDTELVIRYFSWKYFASDYNGNLKAFFDKTVKTLNENWIDEESDIKFYASELDKAIEYTNEIFGEKESFSKWIDGKYQQSFNRAIFDIMTFYFSFPQIRDLVLDKKIEIKEKFQELCEKDNDFISSFETSTKNVKQVKKRFNTWALALADILKIEIRTL